MHAFPSWSLSVFRYVFIYFLMSLRKLSANRENRTIKMHTYRNRVNRLPILLRTNAGKVEKRAIFPAGLLTVMEVVFVVNDSVPLSVYNALGEAHFLKICGIVSK